MPVDLKEALSFHQRGDLDRARQLYEAALAENPRRDDALHLLGMVALQKGDPALAASLIERAVALRPDSPNYRSCLAEAYRLLGQPDRAIQTHLEAHRLNPASPEILCNLGAVLMETGRLDDAVTALRQAIRLNPRFAGGYNNLGNALRLQGNASAALEQYRISVSLDPNSANAQANLGLLLLDRGDLEPALAHCQEAVRLRPDLVEPRVNLGNVFHTLARLDEAEASFREAIRVRPDSPAALAGLGGILEQKGETEEALATMRQVLRLEPRHAGVLARLATRLRGKLPPDEQAAIERLLDEPGLPAEQRCTLSFGLAQVFDDQGEFDRAAALSTEANGLQHTSFEQLGLGYQPTRHTQFIDQMIESFSSEFFDRFRDEGLASERPVFIFGMPRSGTSLIEQILASHPRVFGAGELRLAGQVFHAIPEVAGGSGSLAEYLRQLDRNGLQRLAGQYLDGLSALDSRADRVVDKMPENTLYLGLIAAMFPKARLIHCQRDPRDVAISCWMTLFGQIRWTCDPDHIASRIAESRRLMDHWRRVLPVPILTVSYEEVVNDLETKARELVAWCGLDWNPACLEFHKTRRPVKTASALQVRQPIYRGSVARWKHYEKSLAPLFQALEARGLFGNS